MAFHVADQVRARIDCPATVKAVRELSQKWPQTYTKLIEDKANGSAVVQMLQARDSRYPSRESGRRQSRPRCRRESAHRGWQRLLTPPGLCAVGR